MPADEQQVRFSSFSVDEVSIETPSPQCATGLCLVNHFQGRVSCPYGQTQAEADAWQALSSPEGFGARDRLCTIAGTDGSYPADRITVPVAPQKQRRQADDAVYCSCRCMNADGESDDGAAYCSCPPGFACRHLIDDIGLGSPELAGGYCVKSGTDFSEAEAEASPECLRGVFECDSPDQTPWGPPSDAGSSTTFFTDRLTIGPSDGDQLVGTCLPRELAVHDDNMPLCKVVEVTRQPNAAPCTGNPGRQMAEDDLAAAILNQMRALDMCGAAAIPCDEFSLCQLTPATSDPQDPGFEDPLYQECLNAPYASIQSAVGYCYIDGAHVHPETGEPAPIGNPELAAACPPHEQRLLRFVSALGTDAPLPWPDSTVFVACLGAVFR